MKLIRTEPEAFYVEGKPVVIGPADVATVAEEVPSNPRKRMRVCLHESIEDRFHDMVIVYTDKTKIQPHKHVGKDETLIVLEGRGVVELFDDDLKFVQSVFLEAYGSAFPFCIRIPANTYHTLIMFSERLVLYVATPGPFNRDDTVWAPT